MRGKECGFDAIGLGEGLANGVGISGALMYSTALARYNKTRHAGTAPYGALSFYPKSKLRIFTVKGLVTHRGLPAGLPIFPVGL